jgi:hypothetical protein
MGKRTYAHGQALDSPKGLVLPEEVQKGKCWGFQSGSQLLCSCLCITVLLSGIAMPYCTFFFLGH